MASDGRQMAPRGRALRIPLLALAAAALMALALAAPADADVVYANAPVAGAAEVPSSSFEETGTAELGSLVRLTGAARLDPQVWVAMTTSGASGAEPFSAPVTLSVYAPAADRATGQLLARQTESFEFGGGPGVDAIEFSLPGVTLPDEAIFSVAADDGALAVALAGPPAAGANPREAEGVYRAATAEGAAGPFEFEASSTPGPVLQPAFTVEASAASTTVVAAPATTASAPPALRTSRREYSVPPSKRMTVSFPRPTARIAGPGALVQVRCTGSSAARCIGTLSLETAGTVHKAPFSISKGRKQYVVVPLGDDLEHLDALAAPRATATASTLQLGGAAVKTRRALRLK
jgi:hypothetical protein